MPQQVKLLRDTDDGVRYWAAVGLHAAGTEAEHARPALTAALKDSSAVVRIEAAAALAELGETNEPLRVLEKELRSAQSDVALHAARALQLLGERARPVWPAMREVCERARRDEKAAGDPAMYLRFSLESALHPDCLTRLSHAILIKPSESYSPGRRRKGAASRLRAQPQNK